jgi:hypothetical protein
MQFLFAKNYRIHLIFVLNFVTFTNAEFRPISFAPNKWIVAYA